MLMPEVRIGSPYWEGPAAIRRAKNERWSSQSHVRWECKYHVVFIPKYRHKVFYGKTRKAIGPILRDLCRQKGVELIEGNAVVDHVHMVLSVPPRYSIAMIIGFLKGKSAIRIHRDLMGQARNFTGLHFWARGYCVSTVGLDEETIRRYVREQEAADQKQGRFFE